MIAKFYHDKGQCMIGELTDKPIVIPVLLKEYNGYQHSLVISINPNSSDYAQIAKAKRKQNENIHFVRLKLRLLGSPDDISSWKIEDKSELTDSMLELFGGQWMSRIESFMQHYCTVGALAKRYGMTNFGETFYLNNAILGNAKDCVVHLYGKGKILPDTLENVLVYIHGEYDEV